MSKLEFDMCDNDSRTYKSGVQKSLWNYLQAEGLTASSAGKVSWWLVRLPDGTAEDIATLQEMSPQQVALCQRALRRTAESPKTRASNMRAQLVKDIQWCLDED